MPRSQEPTESRDAGFSLVELLVVIVLLGVIAAVTVFSVRGVTAEGDQSACAEDLRLMQTATESYFAQRPDDSIQVADPPVAGKRGTTPELTLVEVGLLHAPSDLHDVDADGAVTPQPASPCT